MNTLEKQVAILEELRQLEGHEFVSKDGVLHYTEPFGFKGSTYIAKSDAPGTFKGLQLWDDKGNRVEQLEGQASYKMIMEICDHLGIKYQEYFGKGTQYQSCLLNLEEFLLAK